MRAGLAIGVAAIAVLAGGCSLVSPVAAPVVPTFPATTSATPPPATAQLTKEGLPTSCKDLMNGDQLDAALGMPLSAVVKTLVGVPNPDIGLTGRVTCSYGIPSPAGTYALEVSLTAYTDVAAAAVRVPVTVEARRTPGVEAVPLTIGRMNASYLALPDGPVLVAATGTYAILVSMAPGSVTPEQAPGALAAVAGMALTNVQA
ncbi:hypothetical protein [Rhodococcus sp. X156]|uniref:hypothetical protein n=1 Tax=Rhodococcus sp. X156 TaxID=2499145 RepID=UPI000FD9EE09|nr:hypothetical protein [Rhodococcus sp. X156]